MSAGFGLRLLLEQALEDRGWEKVANPIGYPENAWIKPPTSSTKCCETGLLQAITRQLQLEDDFPGR